MQRIIDSMANISQDFQYSSPPLEQKNKYHKQTIDLFIKYNNDKNPNIKDYYKEYNIILENLSKGCCWKILE